MFRRKTSVPRDVNKSSVGKKKKKEKKRKKRREKRERTKNPSF
jgi:hypothetical protein